MNMQLKHIICLLAVVIPTTMHADILTDILQGKYNATTLSEHQTDSLLGNQPASGRYTLEEENKRILFRHSYVADYYIQDNQKETRTLLGGGPVHDVQMSPNGRYVAFSKGNNLYIHKLDFGTEVAVTQDQTPRVYNGTADWVYEEEFGQTILYAFSPDSKQLAYVRLDESQVPLFTYQNMLSGSYPQTDSIYYPRPGENNPTAEVRVYDIPTKATHTLLANTDEDRYIPRIKWTNESTLMALTLHRDQNQLQVMAIHPRTTLSEVLYRETSDQYYVDYTLFDQWQWLSDGRIIVVSEKNGWRSAYLYTAQGIEERQLTPNGTDLTSVYGYDESNQLLYYQAAPTSQTRQCYAVNIRTNRITPLTPGEEGMYQMTLSNDHQRAIVQFQNRYVPNRYTLCSVAGARLKTLRTVEDNDSVGTAWKQLALPEEQWIDIPTPRSDTLRGWIIYPRDMDATKRYPLMVLQYSGPQSQRVLDRWRKRWEYALAAEGYVVLCVDTRGTDCRGRAWRNASYMHLGEVEAEDLVVTADYMARQAYIDTTRMTLCGWSYGGYQTLMTLSHPQSRYTAGIAIAPVTDWRLYDSAYTERYMRRWQVNEQGYTQSDAATHAKDLHGRLLIIHGLGDDNVHAQHTWRYVEALNNAGIQYDMQIYPDDNHFLRKGQHAEHMHRKIMEFLNN